VRWAFGTATDTPTGGCLGGRNPHYFPIDPNGNVASKIDGADTWTYFWNAENQLAKVEKNGVEIARFSYDPMGRRVEKLASGVTTYTYEDESILREVRGGATLMYVQGPAIDEPLARDDGTSLTYFHVDGLGSVVKTTTAAGTVNLARQYDSWGNLETASSEQGYAFTGREWDPETGLYYYRARYYDATVGRFVSADPIRFLGGVNFYAYVINNPTGNIDPFGLLWWNPKSYWDLWKQYQKQKKCAETVIECDKRVRCKCSEAKSESARSVCQTPATNCCAKVAFLCEGGFSFNLDNCAPPCPPDPSPTPPPPPNPCNVYGQNSKQCRDWWEDWKRKNGGEW
jgi:RHS repeat-associated protein